MAQLRDARTSELLAEGTPTEVVLIAQQLGGKTQVVEPGDELQPDVDLIFDGVGRMDPQAVIDQHESNKEFLESLPEDEREERQPLFDELDDLQKSVDAKAQTAQEEQLAARDRVGE